MWFGGPQSTGSRTRRASGKIQWVQRPETRDWWCESCLSKSLRTRNTNVQAWERWLSQLKQRKWVHLSSAFCSIQTFRVSGHAHPHGEDDLLSSFCSGLILRLISSRHTPYMHPEIMFHLLSGHPLAQSRWRIKLAIIPKYHSPRQPAFPPPILRVWKI